MWNTYFLCTSDLRVNGSHVTNIDIRLHTFRPWLLDLPRPKKPEIGKIVTNLMQDAAHWTCPYYLSLRLQKTDIISSVWSFCISEAEGASSRSLCPKSSRSWHDHYGEATAGHWCLVPMSRYHGMAERTQASYTLTHILSEWCLVVKTSKSSVDFR